jgi:hypothetical protein
MSFATQILIVAIVAVDIPNVPESRISERLLGLGYALYKLKTKAAVLIAMR